MIALGVLGPLLGAPLNPAGNPGAKDTALLAGTWLVESATWAGQPLTLPGKDRKADQPITWVFEGDTFKAFVGGAEPEDGTFRVDPGQSPKHLDLIPPKGAGLSSRKCLYAVRGDELTIALSLWFAPGSPKDEAKEGAKMRATRPATLAGKRGDPILTLTLRRQKN